jgi:hypothetical protein
VLRELRQEGGRNRPWSADGSQRFASPRKLLPLVIWAVNPRSQAAEVKNTDVRFHVAERAEVGQSTPIPVHCLHAE